MKLTLSPHPYKHAIFNLFLDDEPWKEVHASIFGKPPRIDGLEEPFNKTFLEREWRYSKNFALRRLVQKNYSSYEIEKLLLERSVSKESIRKVVAELVKEGYINDLDWISNFIRRNKEKKYGPKNIVLKLRMKGVPEGEIERALGELEEQNSSSDQIKKLLETKYSKKDLSDFKEKQKVIASLIRRGFDYEAILPYLQNIPNKEYNKEVT